MGGMNSGLSTHRRTVESMLELDVRKLKRESLLVVGTQSTVSWSSHRKQHSQAGMIAAANAITVAYSFTGSKQSVKQTIWLNTTPCNYGRERVWFSCPCCGRRVAIVYLSNQVACRKCHDLNYKSQRETDNDRRLRRMHKIQDKLSAGTYSIFASTPQRPKYMKRHKYNRLWIEHMEEQERALGALGAIIRRM